MTEQNNVSLNPKAPEQENYRGLSRHIQLIAIGGTMSLFMGSSRATHMAGPSRLFFMYMLIGAVIFLVLRAMGEFCSQPGTSPSLTSPPTLSAPWRGFFLGWSYWFMWVVTAVADIIAIVGYLHVMVARPAAGSASPSSAFCDLNLVSVEELRPEINSSSP